VIVEAKDQPPAPPVPFWEVLCVCVCIYREKESGKGRKRESERARVRERDRAGARARASGIALQLSLSRARALSLSRPRALSLSSSTASLSVSYAATDHRRKQKGGAERRRRIVHSGSFLALRALPEPVHFRQFLVAVAQAGKGIVFRVGPSHPGPPSLSRLGTVRDVGQRQVAQA